jgi:hypothetical protein
VGSAIALLIASPLQYVSPSFGMNAALFSMEVWKALTALPSFFVLTQPSAASHC